MRLVPLLVPPALLVPAAPASATPPDGPSRVEGYVVVQKLVVDAGDLRAGYLGPPESRRVH